MSYGTYQHDPPASSLDRLLVAAVNVLRRDISPEESYWTKKQDDKSHELHCMDVVYYCVKSDSLHSPTIMNVKSEPVVRLWLDLEDLSDPGHSLHCPGPCLQSLSTREDTKPLWASASRDHRPSVSLSRQQYRKNDHFDLQHEDSNDSTAPAAHSPPSNSRSWFPIWVLLWTHWKWEVYSCLLAMATIIATIVTLYPNDGHPIPQWLFKVSINALLAVYALTFKSAIVFVVSSCLGQLQWLWFSFDHALYDLSLYDDAGRGPTGSVRFLWAQHIRQPLASVGAVVMVASVAVGPFMQQLVRSSDCNTPIGDETATLPRTNVFDGSTPLGIGRGIETAVNSGMYTLASASGNFAQCTTGNCTFDKPFRTLGFCSSCKDCSDNIIFESTCSDGAVLSNGTDAEGLPHRCPTNSTIHIVSSLLIESSLPKLSITSEWTYDDSRERWAIPDFSKKIELCKADFVWSNTQRQGVKIRILAGKTIFSENGWNQLDGQRITGCETIAPKDTWHCRGWGAATCDFQPCVRTYNASITAGILTEYLIDVSYPRLWGRQLEEDDLSLIDTKCTTEEQNSLLKQQGYAIDDKDIWIRYNISTSDSEVAYRRGPFVESLLDRGCLFIFSNNNLLFGLGAIPDNLVGNVTARLDSKEMESLSSWSTRNYYGPAALRHLYEYGQLDFNKIESTFANISESSTKYLRMNGAKAYSKPAVGQVMHYATCLKVQWTWIALPATLGALTLGLFLTVVATTEKHQIPVWKSSILPWIFRGPLTPKSGDSDDEGQGVDTTEAMNEKAKATIINLEGPSIRLAETQIQSDGSRSQLHVHVYGNMPEFSDPL